MTAGLDLFTRTLKQQRATRTVQTEGRCGWCLIDLTDSGGRIHTGYCTPACRDRDQARQRRAVTRNGDPS